MKYLNLGCGNRYVNHQDWVNLDFVSTGKNVIAHNLLKGIPYPNETFELVYHSHVLEHFSKNDGENFLEECFRVLKKNGILRIAIPNLEQIAIEYLKYLNLGVENPNDREIEANYNWMLLEMYDQTVRHRNGGDMAKYLYQDQIINENFVMNRVGEGGRIVRDNYMANKDYFERNPVPTFGKIKSVIKSFFKSKNEFQSIGAFRLGGEIHQWMYDRYSLKNLCEKLGGESFIVTTAFKSYLANWESFELDGTLDNSVRKPDSLFIECRKT